MTIFGKIYFTLLILSFILSFFSIPTDEVDYVMPFIIISFSGLGYLVLKLILYLWGINIHWFMV